MSTIIFMVICHKNVMLYNPKHKPCQLCWESFSFSCWRCDLRWSSLVFVGLRWFVWGPSQPLTFAYLRNAIENHYHLCSDAL